MANILIIFVTSKNELFVCFFNSSVYFDDGYSLDMSLLIKMICFGYSTNIFICCISNVTLYVQYYHRTGYSVMIENEYANLLKLIRIL